MTATLDDVTKKKPGRSRQSSGCRRAGADSEEQGLSLTGRTVCLSS